MEQCYKRLDGIAKKTGDAPENTRSNPADRIKRFRENANWKEGEYEDSVLGSKFYKESAILLLHCVLSPLYGKNVYLTSDSFESLIEKNEIPEGGKYFLKKAREALCEKEEKDGLLIDKEKFIRIYYNDEMIGVFSSSGPIPSIECPFLNFNSEDMFLKKKFKNLDIEALKGTETLLNCLDDNEKKLIKLYLDRNKEKIGNCGLFKKLTENLKNVDSEIISSSFEMDSSIPFSFPLITGTGKVVNKYGKKTTHNSQILADRLVIVPLFGEQSSFGYSIEALKFSLIMKNDETNDDETRWYACIPPLTSDAIKLFNDDKLEFTSISIKGIERDDKIEGKPIITSLSIECVTTLKNAKSVDIFTYTEEKITYIDKFPILYLYGIAPKFGWIARRDVKYDFDFPSPLKNKKIENVGNVRDITLEGLTFENSDEKYNYSIYKGKIDEWVAIKNGGNYYGALPLRAGRFDEKECENVPAFVHKKFPEDRVMQVSVDIGSSRSIVLFTDDPSNVENCKSILIENEQELAISIMDSLDGNSTQDSNFERERFQFNKAICNVEGKNPLSVILINRETKKNEEISLYKHGKLFFWNPNEITKFNYEGAVVKIKSSLSIKDKENKTKSNKANKAMSIVIQGLLSLIIDRSMRAKCSTIEIRTAYLTEYYETMVDIWKKALENFKDIIRQATIINTQENKLCDAVIDGNGNLYITVVPYLPESLAIANKLCRASFQANSGAAIVDIGDYSTDVAIFKTLKGDPTNIELNKNFSIYFGGSEIFLQTIWDYLRKTFVPGQEELKTRLENIFNIGKFGDDNQKGIDKSILNILEKELKTHREEEKNVEISNDVKSCLLHIIHRLNPSGKDKLLQDLIDLAYLAIMLILKQSISEIGGEGSFDIYLFGGGSFQFKKQMLNEKDGGFDWKGVLNRECGVFNRSSSNDVLAKGLLLDINGKIGKTVKEIENNVNGNDKIPELKFSNDKKELKEAYSKFIERAKELKKDWSFVRKIENSENFTFLDAEIDENGELIKNNEKLHINESYTKNYGDALEFAIKCMPKKGESEIFSQVFRIIFAYKLAYLSVLNDENVMEIKYGSDKNA